jgi:putative ABC transport system substrate-binding protein
MSSRRDFITLLGGAAAALPLAARAQHPGKLPTIGFLGTTDPSTMRPWITAFVERLRDLGWIEDRTIAICGSKTQNSNSAKTMIGRDAQED